MDISEVELKGADWIYVTGEASEFVNIGMEI